MLMKTYNVVFDKEKNKGVYGISLVENPAMEGNFIALSKEDNKIKLAEIDKEQRLLIGLVLEPNKPIYRNQNNEEFNIVFNQDTIKELSHNFFISNNQKNSTLEHQEELKLEGVTFVESWIVENPNIDKSTNFGLSYPKGSWIATMKVDDELLWDEIIKTGHVKGFSVDAMVNLEEIKLNSDMSKVELNEGFFDKLKITLSEIFTSKKDEEVKLEEVKVEEEIKEEVVVETKPEVEVDLAEKFMEALSETLTSFKTELQKEVKEVKDENVKLKAEMLELGKQPISKAVKSAPVQKEQKGLVGFLNNKL